MTICKAILTGFTALMLAGSVAGAPVTTPDSAMPKIPDMANPAPTAQTMDPQVPDMQGMDMRKTTDQCAQMRLRTKPGVLSPDMQKTMTECDEMDRNTAAAPGFYVPPPDPRR